MKMFLFSEYDPGEYGDLRHEFIVKGKNIEEAVKKYIRQREEMYYKRYGMKISITINKIPNQYLIYSGYAEECYEDKDAEDHYELFEVFNISLKEIVISDEDIAEI